VTKENTHVYFLGTAGAGKSSLAGAYLEWCRNEGLDAVIVNLDPGVERLPYQPEVDVREWVNLKQIMEESGLGPNGAQVAASDLIAMQADRIKGALDELKADYVLLDAPGQIELFVFRQSGRFLTEFLAPERSLIAYLIDPILAKQASSYVSQVLLGQSVQFRLGLPMTNVLSKMDLLEPEELEKIMTWSQEPDSLESALLDEQASMYREMNLDILRSLQGVGTLPGMFPVSAANVQGLEDLYAALQLQFSGGDDPNSAYFDPADSVDRVR
jgi:GPN-loop GTPase